jgi:phosphoglycolate phosphatase-like HAD superfamily hydrolase
MDDDAALALEELRDRGIVLAVSSNTKQAHVDRFAARYPGLFELTLGFGPTLAKGEPHVSTVCDRLGVARSQLVFVGDSIRDGELAAACGLRFIGRTGTFGRDVIERKFPGAPVVDHVDELPSLF